MMWGLVCGGALSLGVWVALWLVLSALMLR